MLSNIKNQQTFWGPTIPRGYPFTWIEWFLRNFQKTSFFGGEGACGFIPTPTKIKNNVMQNFLKIFMFPWNLIEPWNYHNPCSYQGEMFDFKSERCGQPFCSAFFRNPLGNKASDKRGYNLVLSEGGGILIWHFHHILLLNLNFHFKSWNPFKYLCFKVSSLEFKHQIFLSPLYCPWFVQKEQTMTLKLW